MNKVLLVLGFSLLLMVYGASEADSISSSIVCDGATWIATSVIGEAQTYAASLFTTDYATIERKLNVGETISALVSGESEGPMGVDEYTGQNVSHVDNNPQCLFSGAVNETRREDEISSTGLFLNGTYVSTRTISGQTVGGSIVNGTGILLMRATSNDGNNQISHASDIAGSMNITENVVFGDPDD